MDRSEFNDLGLALKKIEGWFEEAHYVGVVVRRNGNDVYHEADFLECLPSLFQKEIEAFLLPVSEKFE